LPTLASFLFVGAKANAQSNACKAFITASESNHGDGTVIKARNVSHQPIVAYVITNTPIGKDDTKSYSLQGVFTDGDSLRPSQAIQIGAVPRRRVNGLLQVDYVRLADGTSCGASVTQDAKAGCHSLQMNDGFAKPSRNLDYRTRPRPLCVKLPQSLRFRRLATQQSPVPVVAGE